jgi:hypothetical protein
MNKLDRVYVVYSCRSDPSNGFIFEMDAICSSPESVTNYLRENCPSDCYSPVHIGMNKENYWTYYGKRRDLERLPTWGDFCGYVVEKTKLR